MLAIQNRVTHVLLVLVLLALMAVIGMLATDVRGGPLDPPGVPAPTDGVKLPGTPISTAPYTISQSGHYYLTRDLSVSSGIAITINANSVSLDLSGFRVSTGNSAGTWGIYLSGQRLSVSIKNGSVSGFQFGIDAGDDFDVIIDHVSANSNVRAFQLGNRNTLSNCTASANQETGIYVPGSHSSVRNCDVTSNAGVGVSLAGNFNLVESSFVVGNNISSNASWAGVLVNNGSQLNTVKYSVLGANVDALFALGSGHRIIENSCAQNGIDAGGSIGSHVVGNVGC